jgi:hypothetical protein
MIALATLVLIIAGAAMIWHSGRAMPGASLVIAGLAVNAVMAASRHWPRRREHR